MTITYRPYRETDSISEITQLLRLSYARLTTLGLKYTATWQDDALTLERIQQGTTILAVSNSRIVGTITLEDARETKGCDWYERPGVASFHQYATHPSVQGQGVGSQLLTMAEEIARKSGATDLALDTADRAYHLIAMYFRKGYDFVGTADWEDTNYESVILNKSLTQACRKKFRKVRSFLRPIGSDKIGAEYREIRARLAESSDEAARLLLLGQLGNLCSALGKLKEGFLYLEEALGLATRLGNQDAGFSNRIRLASAYQYNDEHQIADFIFRQLMNEMPSDHQLYDFLLQHYGKALVEIDAHQTAQNLFEQALAIRQRKNDPSLRASTQQALDALALIKSPS